MRHQCSCNQKTFTTLHSIRWRSCGTEYSTYSRRRRMVANLGRYLDWWENWPPHSTANNERGAICEGAGRKSLSLSFQLGDPSTQWLLMDDNAPPHRCNAAKAYKTSAGIRTLTWPARSPDLNPIENVWSLLKLYVRRHIEPEDDLGRLEEVLHRGWASIGQETINKIIESLSARIGKVIERNGGCI